MRWKIASTTPPVKNELSLGHCTRKERSHRRAEIAPDNILKHSPVNGTCENETNLYRVRGSLMFPAIVSKHILGHENIYCFIFSQALDLQPPQN